MLKKGQRKRKDFVTRFFTVCHRLWRFLEIFRLVRLEIIGTVPQQGPVLFTPNHDSAIDPIWLARAIRRYDLTFFAKASLWDMKVIGPIVARLDQIPVFRKRDMVNFKKSRAHKHASSDSIATAVDRLLEGRAVIIFAQGGAYRKGEGPDEWLDGCGRIPPRYRLAAIEKSLPNVLLPVVPVAIIGTDQVRLPASTHKTTKVVRRWLFGRRTVTTADTWPVWRWRIWKKVTIIFGDPITLGDLSCDDLSEVVVTTIMRRRLQQAVDDLLAKHAAETGQAMTA